MRNGLGGGGKKGEREERKGRGGDIRGTFFVFSVHWTREREEEERKEWVRRPGFANLSQKR